VNVTTTFGGISQSAITISYNLIPVISSITGGGCLGTSTSTGALALTGCPTVAPTTLLTINGLYFDSTIAVVTSGSACQPSTVKYVSSTQATCQLAVASGTNPTQTTVSVYTTSSTSGHPSIASATVNYLAPPTITALAVTTSGAGCASGGLTLTSCSVTTTFVVTMTGTFDSSVVSGSGSICTGGSNPTGCTIDSHGIKSCTTLTCTVNAGTVPAGTGVIPIWVTSSVSGSTAISSTISIAFATSSPPPQPTITSVTIQVVPDTSTSSSASAVSACSGSSSGLVLTGCTLSSSAKVTITGTGFDASTILTWTNTPGSTTPSAPCTSYVYTALPRSFTCTLSVPTLGQVPSTIAAGFYANSGVVNSPGYTWTGPPATIPTGIATLTYAQPPTVTGVSVSGPACTGATVAFVQLTGCPIVGTSTLTVTGTNFDTTTLIVSGSSSSNLPDATAGIKYLNWCASTPQLSGTTQLTCKLNVPLAASATAATGTSAVPAGTTASVALAVRVWSTFGALDIVPGTNPANLAFVAVPTVTTLTSSIACANTLAAAAGTTLIGCSFAGTGTITITGTNFDSTSVISPSSLCVPSTIIQAPTTLICTLAAQKAGTSALSVSVTTTTGGTSVPAAGAAAPTISFANVPVVYGIAATTTTSSIPACSAGNTFPYSTALSACAIAASNTLTVFGQNFDSTVAVGNSICGTASSITTTTTGLQYFTFRLYSKLLVKLHLT